MTLRLRLLLVLVGIVAVGLVAADVATYTSLRSYLFSQVDSQLQSDVVPVAPSAGSASPSRLRALRRRVGAVPPAGVWVQVRDQSGTVIGETQPELLPACRRPRLPSQLPRIGGSRGERRCCSTSHGSSGAHDRELPRPRRDAIGRRRRPTPASSPSRSPTCTTPSAASCSSSCSCRAACSSGSALLAWWIVRRNLRPLDEMAATAGAIAGGDLSQRVATTDERTEVGPARQRPQHHAHRHRGRLRGAGRLGGASAALPRRRLARVAHPSHVDPRLLRALRPRRRDRPEDLATSMRHIREEANRMSVLVDDLLLLARLDRQRPLAARARRPDRRRGRRRRRGPPVRRARPDRRPAAARPGRRRRATPTVCARSSTTCSPTPCSTPRTARPSTSRVTAPRRHGAASRSPTTARHRPPTSRPTSSNPSTAPTPPGPGPRAGSGSGLSHRVGHRPRPRRHGRRGVGPRRPSRDRGATFWVRVPATPTPPRSRGDRGAVWLSRRAARRGPRAAPEPARRSRPSTTGARRCPLARWTRAPGRTRRAIRPGRCRRSG